MPTVYAPPCVPLAKPGAGDGGATANGVTGSTVNVVYYQPQPGGLTSVIQGAAGTPAQGLATVQSYVAMFNRIFEMYGRHVNLIPFTASGADADPVAAHADAITVAEQDHAFASINGPGETNAYEVELARLHVLCMACGDSATYGQIKQDAPYQWANLPTADTSLFETVDYVASKLNGKDAVWAGDPKMHTRKRTFIVVNETSEPPAPGTAELTQVLTQKLGAGHVAMTSPTTLKYTLDLTTLPAQAATLAEKLKSSGATSVIFAGDPIMPIYLTRACAQIGYFPEWIITGIVLTDTSPLARYYTQSEWAHAFGVSSLAVPIPIDTGDAYRLYRWWYGPRPSPRRWPPRPSSHPSCSSSRASSWPDLTWTPAPSPPGCSGPHRPEVGPRSHSTPTATRAPPRSPATRRRPTTRSSGTTPPPRARRRGRAGHRPDALRQRRRPLQGGHRPVRPRTHVQGGRLGHRLHHPARPRAERVALAGFSRQPRRLLISRPSWG